jgi:hypothetical protein
MAKGGIRANLSSFVLGNPDPKKAFTSGPLMNRLAAMSVAGMGAGFVGSEMLSPLAGGIRELITGQEKKLQRDLLTLEIEAQQKRRAEEARMQQQMQYVQMNAQRLASFAPDLAQRVLAGRRLTQGAVAIGGRPRTDLLTELASYMADGNLQ